MILHPLIFLLLLQSSGGQIEVNNPSQPIVALAGDDVILPCRFNPPISASSCIVDWTKPGLDPKYIHVHQDGRLVFQSQNPSYKYRTILFVDQLIHGNVSLKLFNVKVSDAGIYTCIFQRKMENQIQLIVGAVSTPIIHVTSTNSRVVLQCECKGWYPEPEVLWLDGEGNLLSAGPTETVRGPDDLYTVSSRVTVEKRHSNSFTCRVQQNHINQTRDTHITVPDHFFTAPFYSTFYVIIPVSIAVFIVLCFTVGLKKSKTVCTKRKSKYENEKQEEKDGAQSAIKLVNTNQRQTKIKQKQHAILHDYHDLPRKDDKQHVDEHEYEGFLMKDDKQHVDEHEYEGFLMKDDKQHVDQHEYEGFPMKDDKQHVDEHEYEGFLMKDDKQHVDEHEYEGFPMKDDKQHVDEHEYANLPMKGQKMQHD